ncbi:MAG TPA: sensor histidine kinase [Bryobacteraceae bacterium]|jgi:signal transduction histidine kinase|nr:sensor histidine kinase [Bryobacteraceae bacterium]
MAQTELVTKARLNRLLLVGLCSAALLLLSALLVAFRAIHQIDSNTQLFTNRQALTKSAIDDIERQESELNAEWLQLARSRDVVGRDELLHQIDQARAKMNSALESAYEQAELLRESIYQEGHGLLRWTLWLFAGCVGLSLLCSLWVARASAMLFSKLEQQSAELVQMQYQFLETQEETARRFSHELHDELGQTLTAIKANLSAMRNGQEDRLEDCMHLVDRAIQDVREMSQLLRPTILDDFGLDAALRSLTDSFSQRTGIKVEYQSTVNGRRWNDDAETNLYRIAQEALTNVARHSQATAVNVGLAESNGSLVLQIRDNGRGLDAQPQRSSGLGLAGMQTRAQGCGGTLRIESETGKGLRLEVTCPLDKV